MRDAARASCCCAVHVALIPLALRWRAHVSHLSCCCAVHVARSLLPRLNDYDLKYLQFRVRSKGLNVLSAHAVSARSGRGVDRLADDVLAHCAGDARSCCRARCCGTCCCWGAGWTGLPMTCLHSAQATPAVAVVPVVVTPVVVVAQAATSSCAARLMSVSRRWSNLSSRRLLLLLLGLTFGHFLAYSDLLYLLKK